MKQPAWLSPMLATLTDQRFSNRDWIFECKLDGIRCLAFRNGRQIRLLSRNKQNLNNTYPELVDALREQHTDDFIVDGEVVAFKGKVTSFERLQGRMGIHDAERARHSGIAVYFYLFDLLYLNGHLATELPLLKRKSLLKAALSFDDPLRFTVHRRGNGEAYYKEACRKDWEGLIAKRADSPYVHRRSPDWLKFKCVNQQEFVIGGYTDPRGSRFGFGALLLGYYDGGKLKYAGLVGTGYNETTLRELTKRLAALQRQQSPFAKNDLPAKHVHWVQPKLVAEVGFTEWTRAGSLRHPRFLGLRRDKKPKEVVRET
jgi:bifunctional non-homologous end joining protein LigD